MAHACRVKRRSLHDLACTLPQLRFLEQYAEERFAALDVGHAGRLSLAVARTFVKSACPGPEQHVRVRKTGHLTCCSTGWATRCYEHVPYQP